MDRLPPFRRSPALPSRVGLPALLLAVRFSVGYQDKRAPSPAARQYGATESEPIPATATNLLTLAEMAIGKGQDAIAYRGIAEAIRRVSHFYRAHLVQRQILTRMDSLEEAHAAPMRVLEIDPSYPLIHCCLGNNAVSRRQCTGAVASHREAEGLLGAEAP